MHFGEKITYAKKISIEIFLSENQLIKNFCFCVHNNFSPRIYPKNELCEITNIGRNKKNLCSKNIFMLKN